MSTSRVAFLLSNKRRRADQIVQLWRDNNFPSPSHALLLVRYSTFTLSIMSHNILFIWHHNHFRDWYADYFLKYERCFAFRQTERKPASHCFTRSTYCSHCKVLVFPLSMTVGNDPWWKLLQFTRNWARKLLSGRAHRTEHKVKKGKISRRVARHLGIWMTSGGWLLVSIRLSSAYLVSSQWRGRELWARYISICQY